MYSLISAFYAAERRGIDPPGIKTVASYLRNRPATCRKYYVHPAVLEAYMDESLHQMMEKHAEAMVKSSYALKPEELAVVVMLEQQLIQELQQKVAS